MKILLNFQGRDIEVYNKKIQTEEPLQRSNNDGMFHHILCNILALVGGNECRLFYFYFAIYFCIFLVAKYSKVFFR